MTRLSWLMDWYALESLCTYQPRFGHKPGESLLRSAQAAKADLETQFAPALFEYLFKACAGEVRHAHVKGTLAVDEIRSSRNGHHIGRSTIYHNTELLDPHKALPKIINVFEAEWTSGAFGGGSWAEIARTALMWLNGTLTDGAFIDRCADLQHNNGTVFNKNANINYDIPYGDLRRFLDLKFEAHDLADQLLSTSTGRMYATMLGGKTISLLMAYQRVRGQRPTAVQGRIDYGEKYWIRTKRVTWGTHALTLCEPSRPKKTCPICQGRVSEIDMTLTPNKGAVCDWCYARKKYLATCDNCQKSVPKTFTVSVSSWQSAHWCKQCTQDHAHICHTCSKALHVPLAVHMVADMGSNPHIYLCHNCAHSLYKHNWHKCQCDYRVWTITKSGKCPMCKTQVVEKQYCPDCTAVYKQYWDSDPHNCTDLCDKCEHEQAWNNPHTSHCQNDDGTYTCISCAECMNTEKWQAIKEKAHDNLKQCKYCPHCRTSYRGQWCTVCGVGELKQCKHCHVKYWGPGNNICKLCKNALPHCPMCDQRIRWGGVRVFGLNDQHQLWCTPCAVAEAMTCDACAHMVEAHMVKHTRDQILCPDCYHHQRHWVKC